MKSIFTSLSFLLIASVITSCEYFSTVTHTPKQIKQASEWSDKDQLPGFESCQELPEEDRFLCFKSTISSAVNKALNAELLVSNQVLDQEIVLNIGVDKAGLISLIEIEDAATVFEALPALPALLEAAIESLPSAIAAKKTNVGVAVDTQLKLPIRITATAQ